MIYFRRYGGMTERLKVTVLKTVFAQANVGSNPTPSATRKPGSPHSRLLSSPDEEQR